jgi:flagellar biosynthetic protein FliO
MHYFTLVAQTDMPQELDFGMMIVRMLIFLGIVLILIYFVLKKGLPLLVNPSAYGARAVKILERIPVDQKRNLLVVEVQEKVYLLGSAEGQVNVLMELDAEKIKTQQVAAKGKFENVLKKTFLHKKDAKTG